MLRLTGVSKHYAMNGRPPVEAVRQVSLEVARGEFIVITGRSGSGKTTLLNLVGGMTRPTGGQVMLADQDLWRLPDRQQSMLRNQKIGFVFQFASLLPSLTVRENTALPAMFGPAAARAGADDRAVELLGMVGLAEKLDVYPRQLSAGQQQRVVVARALINRPELLLADEPTSDLDEQTELEIMQLFKEVHETTGVTILLVTHSSQLVTFGTRALTMAGGTFVDGHL